jgi:hypothetical protein
MQAGLFVVQYTIKERSTVISEKELKTLKEFDGRDNLALSVYLQLDTPQKKRSAYDTFRRCIAPHLDGNGTETILRDDLDLVKTYLQTNGGKDGAGLAIFSCAGRLFWRAYKLPVTVSDQVELGPAFDVQPLEEALKEQERRLLRLIRKQKAA